MSREPVTFLLGDKRVALMQGDITRQEVDAIVNAANAGLAGGGGVDGAIHRAAGADDLQKACRAIIEARGRLATGDAVATPGFALVAKHIIHTVGPIFHSSPDPAAELARCYVSCIALAGELGADSVAFPSISTGAFGYPVGEAAGVACDAIAEALAAHPPSEVRLVLFSDGDFETYRAAAAKRFGDD